MHKKVLIKIGTASLTNDDFSLRKERIKNLAKEISRISQKVDEIILVSSGAVAAGRSELSFTKKRGEEELKHKQALAAVGQGILFSQYRKEFKKYKINTAQVLLTPNDFENPESKKNLKRTLGLLAKKNFLAIVNENDTTATEELRFGDNDNLAAKIAAEKKMDILIFLSDTEGFFTEDPHKNPQAKLIKKVEKITPEIKRLAQESKNSNACGGMKSKIAAALFAGKSGVKTALISAENPGLISDIIAEKDFRGTLFL